MTTTRILASWLPHMSIIYCSKSLNTCLSQPEPDGDEPTQAAFTAKDALAGLPPLDPAMQPQRIWVEPYPADAITTDGELSDEPGAFARWCRGKCFHTLAVFLCVCPMIELQIIRLERTVHRTEKYR